jgi:PAS domain S-box-containing protein
LSVPGSSARRSAQPALSSYLVSHPYALAFALLVLGLGLRWLMTPLVGFRLPYITLFPVVFAVAWYAGFRPTLLVTIIGALAVQYFLFPPYFTFRLNDSVGIVGTGLFLLIGIGAGVMGEARRKALIAANEAARLADEERQRAEDEAAKAEEAAVEAEEAAQEAAEALSARLAAEAETRRIESELSEFFENAVVGLHWVGPDGIILRVNRAELEMLGYAASEYVGRHIADFHVDRAVIDEILRRLHADEKLRDYPSRMRCKDGAIKDVLIDASVYWEDGRFIHSRSFTRDVTAQRRTEEAMRALQRLESVGRLAGGVAHEVNNQMSVVLGAANFVLRRSDLPTEARADVELMRDAAQRSSGITSQLLAFGRRQLLKPEVLDLKEVIRNFEPVLLRTAGSQCTVHVRLDDPGGNARVDRNQLEQVLLNLAINAVDAMPQGGALEVRLGPAELNVDDPRLRYEPSVQPGHYAEIAVADSGTGMDERTMEHMFEPFFTTKPAGEGTGLGLSTAYGIIRQTGGYLGFQSAPGRGTVFSIFLPLTTEPVAPLSGEEFAPIATGREVVLVVEDEVEVRRIAARALRAAGHEVLEAADGEAALDLIRSKGDDIRLVLTDLAMPRMGGFDLAREVASIAPRIQILFMTGYTSSEAMRRNALRLGYAMLEKPFTPEILAARVRAALDTLAGAAPTAR